MKISMIPNKIVKLIHASKGDTSLRKWAFEPYDNNGAINVSNIKDQLVYKTENGGTEQLLPVNTSTPTTSYFDGTIKYDTDTDTEFTYKQSSYTGKARIKSIKGNTLVWNQLVQNGNFADTSNWNTSSVTFSVNNNEATILSTSDGAHHINQNVSLIEGHKYFFKADVKASVLDQANTIIFYHGAYSSAQAFLYTISNANTWETASNIFTCTGATNQLRFYSRLTTQTVNVRNVVCFDLTMNGFADNVDQFKSLFSLPYYAHGQYLLNFNGEGIKTTGKNLWEGFESKTVSGITVTVRDDGALVLNGTATANAFIQTNPLDIKLPSNTYHMCSFNSETSNYVHLSVQNQNGQYIVDTTLSQVNRHITFTDNIMVAQIYVNSGATLNNFVVKPYLGLVESDEFEPCTSSTLSLPISTYFPTGMKSVPNYNGTGIVRDELSDKAITKVYEVDMGTLNWSYNGTRFTAVCVPTDATIKKVGLKNLLCAKYTTSDAETVANMGDKEIKGNSSSADIYVKDSSYTTLESFVSAMSGQYLNYELATYTETDIQNASLVCKNIEVPCYLSNGNLVCDATEELTNESGFFDAKLKLKDSSSVAYSSKFKLHVEDL